MVMLISKIYENATKDSAWEKSRGEADGVGLQSVKQSIAACIEAVTTSSARHNIVGAFFISFDTLLAAKSRLLHSNSSWVFLSMKVTGTQMVCLG